jgi:hypothetical protein
VQAHRAPGGGIVRGRSGIDVVDGRARPVLVGLDAHEAPRVPA